MSTKSTNPLDDLPTFRPPVRLIGGDVAGASCHITQPQVATLPDGTRINLPVGTTLRAGAEERPNAVATDPPWSQVAANIRSMLGQNITPGEVLAMLLGPETYGLGELRGDVVRRLLAAEREPTPEENFAALKRGWPALAGAHERAAAKHGVKPWDVTDEQLWEECPPLRPGYFDPPK